MARARTDYETRFAEALSRITRYMSPERLRRHAEKTYGLDYEEALEMAYENMLGEAKAALAGYRPKRRSAPPPAHDAVDPHADSTGTLTTRDTS
jgi:hypothetical protein